MSTIRILAVAPRSAPEIREIGADDLTAMQEIVGGYIEGVRLEGSLSLICNEEGKLQQLTPNRYFGDDIICGTFFVTRYNRSGDNVSITEKDYIKYSAMFALGQENVL